MERVCPATKVEILREVCVRPSIGLSVSLSNTLAQKTMGFRVEITGKNITEVEKKIKVVNISKIKQHRATVTTKRK